MKLIQLIIILTISLFILNCSNSTESSEDAYDGPVFTKEYMDDNFDYQLDFSESSLMIFSKYEVTSCIFILNGKEVDTEWLNRGPDDYWMCWIYYDYLPEGINMQPDAKLGFYLNINEDGYIGNITIPYPITIDWPEFTPGSDYSFTWEIGTSTQTQRISSIYSTDSLPGQMVTYSGQFDGGKRNHTISKDFFKPEVEDDYTFSIMLIAMNFLETGRCFVSATSSDLYFYPITEQPDILLASLMGQILQQKDP